MSRHGPPAKRVARCRFCRREFVGRTDAGAAAALKQHQTKGCSAIAEQLRRDRRVLEQLQLQLGTEAGHGR